MAAGFREIVPDHPEHVPGYLAASPVPELIIDDLRRLWGRPGVEEITFGKARLFFAMDRWRMAGPSGEHSLDYGATSVRRLNAHWQTFASAPINQETPR